MGAFSGGRPSQRDRADTGRYWLMSSPVVKTAVPPIPRVAGLVASGVSLLVLLSALTGAGAAALNSPPVWFMLGFELVIAIAAAFGVLVGLGRFGDGPALALLCVAGTIGTGSLLGYLAGSGNIGVKLEPFLLAREAAGAVIAAAAAYIVLIRRPRLSVRRLVVGLLCAGAFAAIGAVLWKFSGQLVGLGTLPGAFVGLVGAVTLLGLLAAAVHLLVSAFETGAIDEAPAASSQ